MAARKRQYRAAATVTGPCRPRFRFTDIEARMMIAAQAVREVSPRVGSAVTGWPTQRGSQTTLGLAPTRRGHAEHTAALLNSSGLWVSSRTRGGRGWHAAAASGRFSIGPLMQLAERNSSRGASCSTTATPRRCAMTSSFVTKLAVTLALALTTAATVSFAQSRPQSCIPHYDASGAQEAPYC